MGWFEKLKRSIGIAPKFLCDNCKYDYAATCSNSARPNVTSCSEFRKK